MNGPSSRGNSNASSMDILPPHHFGSEAASPPTSPTLQRADGYQYPSPTLQHNGGLRHAPHSPHASDAYFGSGMHARAVRTGSAHLRDPQPDSLQVGAFACFPEVQGQVYHYRRVSTGLDA